MLYLVQIQRKRLSPTLSLTLLAVQRGNKLWAKVSPPTTINTTFNTQLKDDTLALAELSKERQVLKLNDAALTLPDLLHSYSVWLIKFSDIQKEAEKEVELWRTSLETQARELSDRANKIAAREENVTEREENVTEQEIQVTRAIAHTKEWEAKIDTARVALAAEWEKLKAEQRNHAKQ